MKNAAVLLALAFVACGGSSTAPGANIVGVYQLNTLNGGPLPAVVVVSNGETTYLNGEVLTVNAGGTYQTNGAETQKNASGYGGSFPVGTAGTYAISGGGYTFSDNTLGSGSGTLSGSTLTVSLGGAVYVFAKQ